MSGMSPLTSYDPILVPMIGGGRATLFVLYESTLDANLDMLLQLRQGAQLHSSWWCESRVTTCPTLRWWTLATACVLQVPMYTTVVQGKKSLMHLLENFSGADQRWRTLAFSNTWSSQYLWASPLHIAIANVALLNQSWSICCMSRILHDL